MCAYSPHTSMPLDKGRSARPPAPLCRSSEILIGVQQQQRSLLVQYSRGGRRRHSIRVRCPPVLLQSSCVRWLTAARRFNGQLGRPWWRQLPRRAKRMKANCYPRWGQRYIQKVNKLSISHYLYVCIYDNIGLSAPCLLVRALLTSFLFYFRITPALANFNTT